MVSFLLIAPLALAAIANAASAPVANDSPMVSYTASFNTNNAVGTFNFTGQADGSIRMGVDISKFPSINSRVYYYIHEKPIPENGTCWDTKGIFNPYNGTYPTGNETVPPSTVAVGDFPHSDLYINGGGIIESEIFAPGSPYWSLNPNNTAFIGNLSVVFQYADKTPIACGNIVKRTTQPSQSGASKMAGAAAALPLALGVAALLI